MKTQKFTLTALLFTFCMVVFAQENPSTIFQNVDDTEQYDVLALAKEDPNLSTFVELVELSGLGASVNMADEYTVFIPTNTAFEQLSKEKYEKLTDPSNKTELIEVLKRHILPNKIYSSDLEDSQVISTGNSDSNEEITVSKDGMGSTPFIGGAEVVKADVEASNGIIHIVNAVIQPTSSTMNNY